MRIQSFQLIAVTLLSVMVVCGIVAAEPRTWRDASGTFSVEAELVDVDGEGKSLVGLPNIRAGAFTGGDWMIRAQVDSLK